MLGSTSWVNILYVRFPAAWTWAQSQRCDIPCSLLLLQTLILVSHAVSPRPGLVKLLALSNFQARRRSQRDSRFTGHLDLFCVFISSLSFESLKSWTWKGTNIEWNAQFPSCEPCMNNILKLVQNMKDLAIHTARVS